MSVAARILEKGKLQIGDLDKAIFHLGNVYDDPRDALAEFVTNGLDAGAAHVLIRLHRRGAFGRIEIEDDGLGMSQGELSRVATSLCDSIKAQDDRSVGEKGIGILGYQEIASQCLISSRTESSDSRTTTLILTRGTRDYSIQEAEAKEKRAIPGTTVRLHGIEKQRMRQFSIAKVEEHLKKKFRVHLATGNLQITVVEGKDARHVQPDNYKGVPFYLSDIRTPYGDVKLSLFVNASVRNEQIAVYHKGNLVLDSITELDEFQNGPWLSDKVTGEISNDFNKLTTGRNSFVRDRKKWPAWVNALKGIEGQLQAEIDRVSSEASREANRQMHKRIRDAFLRALAELPSFGGIAAPTKSNTGEEVPGAPDEDQRLTLIEGEGSGSRKGDPRSRPPITPAESVTTARAGAGFNLIEVPMEDAPDLRSDFDPNTVLIRVNTLHPDYDRESETQQRKESYFVRLIAKEMTLYEYPDTTPANLVEKLLDLELAARRHLESPAPSRQDRASA